MSDAIYAGSGSLECGHGQVREYVLGLLTN